VDRDTAVVGRTAGSNRLVLGARRERPYKTGDFTFVPTGIMAAGSSARTVEPIAGGAL
jgi:hypothetical protein